MLNPHHSPVHWFTGCKQRGSQRVWSSVHRGWRHHVRLRGCRSARQYLPHVSHAAATFRYRRNPSSTSPCAISLSYLFPDVLEKHELERTLSSSTGLWIGLAATMFTVAWLYQFFLIRTNWSVEAAKAYERVFHKTTNTAGTEQDGYDQNTKETTGIWTRQSSVEMIVRSMERLAIAQTRKTATK